MAKAIRIAKIPKQTINIKLYMLVAPQVLICYNCVIMLRLKKTVLFFLLFTCIFLSNGMVYSKESSNTDYDVPIDYSKIDKTALANQANLLYSNFEKITDKGYRQKYILPLLNMYSILSNMVPDEPLYCTRVGILYDELGTHDDYAKANFFKATNIRPDYGYASYAFGNFYYSRGQLRKAIAEYKKANGLETKYSYDRLLKMGATYEKLGDYRNAIDSYKEAYKEQSGLILYNKILLLEDLNSKDVLYHK